MIADRIKEREGRRQLADPAAVALAVSRVLTLFLAVGLISLAAEPASAASPETQISNPEWSILLTSFGYADILLDDAGPNPDRELLSGEWGAAIGYTYDSGVGPMTRLPIWLEPMFVFPDWITNSDFAITIAFRSTGNVNGDGFTIYESEVANSEVRVHIFYEFLDSGTGIKQGTEPASSLGVGSAVDSSRYILRQTYEITNISGVTLTNVNLYQFLHGLNSTSAVYDNRFYGGPFGEYQYDIFEKGESFDLVSELFFEDIVTFHMSWEPTAWEVGHYGKLSVDDHVIGKPSVGVHHSVEADALDGTDLFAPPTPDNLWVSGAQRQLLPDLAPGESTTIDVLLSINAGVVSASGIESFVAFVNPGSNSTQQSFLRVVNTADTPTDVDIEAFDDSGFPAPGGIVETTLDAFASIQLTARDLEEGNAAKGIIGSLGDGAGKWQLAVRPSESIKVMSLIRTPDGFLTSVNDVVPKGSPNEIYFANPASNQNQQSFLRFTNQSDVAGSVLLSGVDDNGNSAPGTDITFMLGPRESKQLTSRDVENGNGSKDLSGALGDGSGKWHLTATSDIDLEVMSLIRTPDGFLTNISGVAPTDVAQVHRIYYANPASETGQATLIRVVNITTSTGTVAISGIDDNGAPAPGGTVQFELGPREAKQLLTTDLENGNASKGLIGTLGDGAGKWQLTVTADMDIAVMNLIRTADGFLTNLSQVAPKSTPNTTEVYLLNPGSNTDQRSLLRIVNTTGTPGIVTITGADDNGDAAPGGPVSFPIGVNRGLVLTAQDIENGNASKGLSGALGDGAGKWHLTVESTVDVAVMSLLDTPNGFITNLSRPSGS